jgi:uncharacterized RDD family membrane protein YckC
MSMPPPPPPPPPGQVPPPSQPYQPPAAYQPPSPYGAAPQRAYAGFGARLGARILDGLIGAAMMIPAIVIGVVLLLIALDDCFSVPNSDGTSSIKCPDGAIKAGPLLGAIAVYVIGAIVVLAIYCRWVGRGQTPGMKATGIRVLDAQTSAPIGTGRAVGRYFASILSGIPCALGYLWMLWDPNKQTWHDKMVNSVVVRA